MDDPKVVIVAAGGAWPMYRTSGGYVCQDGRKFQDAAYMGFYSKRSIHGVAARIEHVEPSVRMNQSAAAEYCLSLDPLRRRIGDLILAALASGPRDQVSQVVLLSPLGDPATQHFEAIEHRGPHAWTMNQRYQPLSALRAARTTEDLR